MSSVGFKSKLSFIDLVSNGTKTVPVIDPLIELQIIIGIKCRILLSRKRFAVSLISCIELWISTFYSLLLIIVPILFTCSSLSISSFYFGTRTIQNKSEPTIANAPNIRKSNDFLPPYYKTT